MKDEEIVKVFKENREHQEVASGVLVHIYDLAGVVDGINKLYNEERKKWKENKKELEDKKQDIYNCPAHNKPRLGYCEECDEEKHEAYKKNVEDEYGKRLDDSISCFQSNLIKKIVVMKHESILPGCDDILQEVINLIKEEK